MGLVAREIEAVGIPTVAISLALEITQNVGVPRALFIKWPLGHPLGEANATAQQRTVLYDSLHLLLTADTPGVIAQPGYRWRRQAYSEPSWEKLGEL